MQAEELELKEKEERGEEVGREAGEEEVHFLPSQLEPRGVSFPGKRFSCLTW